MNKKLINMFMFATGAAIGSLVTWKVVKTKYEQILQDEIDSFKEMYVECMRDSHRDDYSTSDDDEVDDVFANDDPEVIEYHTLTNRYRQSGNEAENGREGDGDDGDDVPYINGPYVIEPGQFADGEYDYDCHCITYYADGILADDWGVKLDIDETIGLDALEHFGDYAEDVVHVRNERLEAEYEVTKDPRNYADVITNDPQLRIYAG